MKIGTTELIILLPIVPIIFGLISRAITKNRGMEGGFWWGFLLGLIGIIVVAVRPNDKQESQNVIISDTSSSIQKSAVSNSEEIKKYKELLDSGIITQEEFDAKKKQLLEL